MSQLFNKLDPLVNALKIQDFDKIQALQLVSLKIGMGCRPSHLVLVSLVLVVLLVVLNVGSYLLSSVVGFLYPAYMSFKALQSKEQDDDKQWLTYWVVFSFFTCFDFVLNTILFFVPFYYVFKMAFYVYLMHPQYKGAVFVYEKLVKKIFQKYEGKIDQTLQQGKEKVQSFQQKATDAVNQ